MLISRHLLMGGTSIAEGKLLIRLYCHFLADRSIPPVARAIQSLVFSFSKLPKGAILGSRRMATILGLPWSTVTTSLARLKDRDGMVRENGRWMGVPTLSSEEQKHFIEMDKTILLERKWSCRVVFAELRRQMMHECLMRDRDKSSSLDPYADKVEALLSIAEVSRNTGFSRHTVKRDIAELCAEGYVVPADVKSGEPFRLRKPPKGGWRKRRKSPKRTGEADARRAAIRQRIADLRARRRNLE